MPTFVRYLAFQAPAWAAAFAIAWALDNWTSLPRWLLGAGVALYLTKDLVLYRFVRPAYELRQHQAGSELVGAGGRVVVALDPEGWVQVGAERWRAQLDGPGAPLEVGAAIRVRALRGHTLLVEVER